MPILPFTAVPVLQYAAVKWSSGTSSPASASFTPPANSVLFVAVQFVTSASGQTATISDTASLPWSSQSQVGQSNTGRLRVFIAFIGSNPSSTQVTISTTAAVTNAVSRGFVLPVYGGVDQNPTTTGSSNLSATGVTATFATAVPAICMGLAFCGVSDTSGTTQPTDDAAYTNLSFDENGATAKTGLSLSYKLSSISTTCTWTTNVLSASANVAARVYSILPPNIQPAQALSRAVANAASW